MTSFTFHSELSVNQLNFYIAHIFAVIVLPKLSVDYKNVFSVHKFIAEHHFCCYVHAYVSCVHCTQSLACMCYAAHIISDHMAIATPIANDRLPALTFDQGVQILDT